MYMRKFTVCLLLSCFFVAASAQKPVRAHYRGGHGCIDKDLVLYADSTFRYEVANAMPFPHTSRTKGTYRLTDTSLTLTTKKRLAFLYFQRKHKYRSHTYRALGYEIRMFPPKAEQGRDSAYIRDYNTLRRY